MKPKLQRTYSPKAAELEHRWYVVDATDVPLGRLASGVATIIRGKHKPTYAPHMDGGDYVVVINAEKVAATGSKETQKMYYRHSGYPGGLRQMTLGQMRERYPERIIESAVRGMLPKNKLGRAMFTKLKVYAGGEHPHAAQAPEALTIGKERVR
ncbi:MAG: 50S ribosomal protein L13 [Acidimicrobiia bacterium]